MFKVLRYFLYFMAGVFVLLALFFLVKVFKGPSANTANAFEWQKPVDVYFGNKNMGSNENCSKVFPVSRTIINAETLGPGSLEALLGGVSAQEKSSGYSTALNDGILLQKFEIKNKVAYIDFNSRFDEGVTGSCKITAIKSQIENTLDNLPDIDSVVISVNGKTKGVLGQ